MEGVRRGGVSRAALLVALVLATATARSAAQPAADPPGPYKSVYGKLQAVDKSLQSVIMDSDTGERLAWRFDAAVIAEAARFKPGDPMIVIYRQIRPNEKRVTALAFPGTASTPTYVNMTGSRVVLRSGPAVNGTCGPPSPGPVTESTMPSGGIATVLEACWCCASHGETCTPGNESGRGKAFLVQCFK